MPSMASAFDHVGGSADRSGDGPDAGRDLTRVQVSYDSRTGRFEAGIQFAGTPSSGQQIAVGMGRRDQSGACSAPMLILGTVLYDDFSVWLREENGTTPAEASGDAFRTIDGSRVDLKATASAMSGLRPNCAEAVASDASNTSVIYDAIDAFAVKAPPKKPRLRVSFSGTGAVKRGASRTVRVKVRNVGDAAAKKVRFSLKARGKGTASPRAKRLGRIAPGKSRTVRVRVRASSRAKGKITLKARAASPGASAKATAVIQILVPQPPPPPSKGGLAGKIFWGFTAYRYDQSPDIVFLHFTNSRFVRWGIPPHGLVRCGRVTAKVKDGEMEPGCLRYSYNRRTGKVKIGKEHGTYRNGHLKLSMDDDLWQTDGESWYPGLVAKPGTRFKTQLINRGYYGSCGITPYCTTWAENLTLTRDGRFGRQESSLSTGGGIGLPFVAISRLGPDEKGHYQVLRNGKIRFRYASGKVGVETLIVQTDKRGRPDPVKEGLLVGDTWFYRED
ncbi:MAG: hypothetical protein J0H98_02565 [Solirubrobacterales bacterium]|nr:hypothetical protein [Solirubrobacterales bacterium]